MLARVTDQVAELSRLVASVTDLARGEPPATDMVPRSGSTPSPPTRWTRRGGTGRRREFDADLDGGVIEGSADRLRVAFKNLLDNAAKFGPPEGPVEVRLTGGEFTVRDHGPGIADEDLPFVFDRFYRALSSRSAPGSGLGLAVVREIVAWHGGTVTAERRPAAAPSCALRLPGYPAGCPVRPVTRRQAILVRYFGSGRERRLREEGPDDLGGLRAWSSRRGRRACGSSAARSGVASCVPTSKNHLAAPPNSFSWSIACPAPFSRSSGGRSAVSSSSGTRASCASIAAGSSSAAAVPEVHVTATGRPLALARPSAKKPAQRSSTCE